MQTQLNIRAGDERRKPGMDRRRQLDRRAGQDRRLEDERHARGEHGAFQVIGGVASQTQSFSPNAAWERRTSKDRRGAYYRASEAVEYTLTDDEIRFLLGPVHSL